MTKKSLYIAMVPVICWVYFKAMALMAVVMFGGVQ